MDQIENKIENQKENEIDINQLSPLVWAFIGDDIYDIFIRKYLIKKGLRKIHDMHIAASYFVKANSQAIALKYLSQKDFFEDDEKEIIRRARNVKNHHIPKNSNSEEYMLSTALEGLIGFLHLTGKTKRIEVIMENIIEYLENNIDDKN